ncbi:MAG: hypothetical protein MZV65_44515 [Chromatiales bacterium]|nr:hypothetical protein [Chromatiales bacterium]
MVAARRSRRLPYRLVRRSRRARAAAAYDAYALRARVGDARPATCSAKGGNYQSYRLLGAHCGAAARRAGRALRRLGAQRRARLAWSAISTAGTGARTRWRSLGASGVWELFIPGLDAGRAVQVRAAQPRHRRGARQGRSLRAALRAAAGHRSDGRGVRSATPGSDGEWMERRAQRDWLHAPMSVYELHLGSWRRHADGRFYSYRELARAARALRERRWASPTSS